MKGIFLVNAFRCVFKCTLHDFLFCSCLFPQSGIAGALAQLTLGAPRTVQQSAYEESMRQQCWEAGNIDYLGKDSFENIWKRITQTLATNVGGIADDHDSASANSSAIAGESVEHPPQEGN